MPHPYEAWSLLPPVVTIVMAIVTRRILLSLLVGLFAGAWLMNGWAHPFYAVADLLEVHIWKTIVDEDKLRVCAFTLLMGAMIGVISRSGGMRGLVELVSPWANTPRRGQLATWFLGLLVFFDDYANTMLLGNTLRPLCDRLRISREKLAYLVDSTAAPVAGLAIVSTWVASEISYIDDGLKGLSGTSTLDATQLFLASIPYRFYVLFALVFVPLLALMNRDFGPMLKAERRRRQEGSNLPDGSRSTSGSTEVEASDDTPGRWYNAVVPILVTLAVVFWLLYSTGMAKCIEDSNLKPNLQDIIGGSDSYIGLLYGSLAGLITAALLVSSQRLLNGRQITAAAGSGAKLVLPALAILMLASVLSNMTRSPASETNDRFESKAQRLYTGDYLSRLLTGNSESPATTGQSARLPLWLLPTIVFVLSALIAFATGTSWGTMGILMPMVIPLFGALCVAAGRSVGADDPLFLGTIGGVLAGSIFGDHCSPISDTTVLSSQSSGCDHMAHVWTQLPYAMLVGVIAILCGTLPLGLGVSIWVLLPLGVIAMASALFLLGKPVDASE